MKVVLRTIICFIIVGSMLINALSVVGAGLNSVNNINNNLLEINEGITDESSTIAAGEKNIPNGDQYDDYIGPADNEMTFPSGPPSPSDILDKANLNAISSANSKLDEAHHFSEVWSGGYLGEGVTIASVDTGVDFGHMDLQGTQAICENITVTLETVITASGGEDTAILKNGGIVPASYVLYKNSTAIVEGSSNDYTINLLDGNITFTKTLNFGEIINASYSYTPVQYGWPIAFDPHSMRKYLSTNDTGGTWYANTSRQGIGPFPLIHDIDVDGSNDFGEQTEKYGEDPRNDAPTVDGGNKYDFDLTDVYVTRDDDYWYMGIPTYPQRAPETYGVYDHPSIGVYIDVDNETSGTATVDPFNNLIDTLTSHSSQVTDVKYSPDGTMVASASTDKTIKIWNTSTGENLQTFRGHSDIPRSIDWSPDSTKLVSVENSDMYLWDVPSGILVGKMRYLEDFGDVVGKDYYDAFTKTGTVSFSPNGTWVAISTNQYVYVVDIPTLSLFGKIYVIGGNYVNTVAFHPVEPWVAVGLGVKYGTYYPVRIYNLNATVLNGTIIAPINRTLGGIGAPTGHDTQITNLAWHPTQRDTLASVSYGGTLSNPSELIIWDVATETMQAEIAASNYSSNLYGVAWSPSGNSLATVESGTQIQGFNSPPVTTIRDNLGVPIETINGTLPVNSVDFSPNGLKLVTGSSDRRASVWDTSGALTEIYTANKPDYALYADTDMIWDQKNEKYVPYIFNATLSSWNDVTGEWDKMHLNNVTWNVTDEVLIANYDSSITSAPFSSATDFAFSNILSFQVFKNGVAWEQDGNYSLEDILNKRVLTLESSADISDGDMITATYVYNTPGEQAYFEWGSMLFNEFSIPRQVLGDPDAISFEVFTVGRDNSTHAQDTVPEDAGVFDLDYDMQGDKGLDFGSEPTSLGNFAYVEIGSYTIDGITSQSSNFHFGFHPSEIIKKSYGALGLLVVDSISPGVYDTVILDMNNDHVFDSSDRKIDRDNPIAWLDNFNKTAATANDAANKTLPDGYPDVSAGMLYFISDGENPIPYSERYAQINGLKDEFNYKTPLNGNLLAFTGEFDIDSKTNKNLEHGTKMASRLVSQGKMDTYKVAGLSPDAKIISIGGKKTKSDVISSWYFAVEGYDGLLGTGDEAQIVVNGFNYPDIYETGWDDYSRTADYISMIYGEERALFVMSAGDDGYGYGTVSAPGAAPGVLTVGSATDNLWTTSQGGGVDGSNHFFGDVPPRASRGPTAMGIPKPDVVAIDTGFTNRPLASVPDGTEAYTFPLPMSGSDHSAAIASSAACLVYQAYYQEHSGFPTASEAKRLLMSGADDVGYDILTQGAGFLNVNRSVAMANDTYGISSSHDFWVPGNYEGLEYDGFASLVEDGDTVGETITLSNHGASTETVNITDTLFAKIGENSFSNYTIENYYYPVTNKTALDWYSPGEIVLWLNDTGLNKVNPSLADGPTGPDLTNTYQNTPQNIIPATPGLWERASMIRVTAYSDFSAFSALDNAKLNYSYRLSLLDWEKSADSNLYGNPSLPVYFPCPSSTGLNFPEGLNVISETYNMLRSDGVVSNVLETRISNPASRVHDGLVIYLNPVSDSMKEEYIKWNFKIEYFEKIDWDWLSLDMDNLTVPGNSNGTFNATVSVPSGTGMGSYEGAISLHYNEQNVNDELIFNLPVINATEEYVNNQTDMVASLTHGNITELQLQKIVPSAFANDTVAYSPDGSEVVPWGFYLPYDNITNYTYMTILSTGIALEDPGVYNATVLAPFSVDADTGYVNFTDPLWNDPLSQKITEFYVWYEYEAPNQLSVSNYTLYSTNGTIILNSDVALQPGEYLTADYSWFMPKSNQYYRLDYTNVVDGTSVITNNGAILNEGTDYALDHIAGIIIFDSSIIIALFGTLSVNYTYYANSVTIPVLINVWSPTDMFDYGGENWIGHEGLYNNSVILSGYDMSLKPGSASEARPYTGDRRFFFFNIPDQGIYHAQGDDMRIVLEADWTTKPSDIDIQLLSKTDADIAANKAAERYGTYTLGTLGGSEETSAPEFNTVTNSSEEIIALGLKTGLNVVMLRGVVLDGGASGEGFTGYSCDVTPSTSVDVVTPDAAGNAPVSFTSNREWNRLNASVVGPAITESYKDIEVQQDYESWWNYPNWGEWNYYATYTKYINLSKALVLEVHIQGHEDAPDLDLAVFRDIDGDGKLTLGVETMDSGLFETPPVWMYNADWDADETVKWVSPPDGLYIIKVIGFDTRATLSNGEPGGHFDLDISLTLDTGKGYELAGTDDKDLVIDQVTGDATSISAFNMIELDILWNFPGSTEDGNYGGAVLMGTEGAPGLIIVPVTISLDRSEPIIVDIGPPDGAIINDPNPTIFASITDKERSEIETARIFVDHVDVSDISEVSVPFDKQDALSGYPLGTIAYVPKSPLSEGTHRVDVIATDWAGNEVKKTWVFTVDTTPADVEMEFPLGDITYINTETAIISGNTEVGSKLTLTGTEVISLTQTDGNFEAMVTLSYGINNLEVITTDLAGNINKIKRVIILDNIAPTISSIRSSEGYLTNMDTTTIQGKVTEHGIMHINNISVIVNSDGSFAHMVNLQNGVNTFHIVFKDYADNLVDKWMNITHDSIAPLVDINIPTISNEKIINISGKIINGYSVKVNGKIPTTDSTRDGDIDFTKSLSLSYGMNIIVIEAEDEAGNVVESRYVVELALPDPGTNYAAIGLMVIMLIVGLLVGLLIAMGIWKEKPEEDEYEPPIEGDGVVTDDEIPPEGEEFTGEEMEGDTELLLEDDIDAEPMQIEDDGEIISGEDIPADGDGHTDMGEEPVEEMADIPEDAEPIPMEEGLPEDIVEEPADMPDEEGVGSDTGIEEPGSEEPAELDDAPAEEDERISRLKKAFEDGKISEELYKKNLAKLQK